jgi:hypothetical protein
MGENCTDSSLFYSEIPKKFWTLSTNPFKSYCTFNFHKIDVSEEHVASIFNAEE